MIKSLTLLLSILIISNAANALVIYMDRKKANYSNAITEYEELTGDSVIVVQINHSELVQRLENEGKYSPAHLVISKDMYYLNQLASKELLQPMKVDGLSSMVPSNMRHPKGLYTALSYRMRTLAYLPYDEASGRGTKESELPANYQEIANSQFTNKLCLRTSNSTYNFALIGELLLNYGEASATSIVSGWINNLKQKEVFTSDSKMLDAINDGRCDFAIVNSYYLGLKIKNDPNYPVRLKFLNQDDGGLHVNGIGAGVSAFANSQNKDNASLFVKIMLQPNNQQILADAHMDYPARIGVNPNPIVMEWGAFEISDNNWSLFSDIKQDVRQIIDQANYN